MNHQTFERILRFRDMPGGMRDGVLVPHITPGRESWWWSLRLDESALYLWIGRGAKCSSRRAVSSGPFEAGY